MQQSSYQQALVAMEARFDEKAAALDKALSL